MLSLFGVRFQMGDRQSHSYPSTPREDCDGLGNSVGDLYIASEVELPPNIIIKEIIETLSKMSLQEQQHILEYIQLFEKFRSLNKL